MAQELYENVYEGKTGFSFGKNWQDFLRFLDQDRIEITKKGLADFLGGPDAVRGKTFVDVGCGSGLFSLAAHLLGAARVVSVDVDRNSVRCAEMLRERQGSPTNWEIKTGSALDAGFMASLGKFDIVYSWGVLHHTGDMYRAIGNACGLVKDDGVFFLAIYNRFVSSRAWWHIKRIYNATPKPLKGFWVGLHYAYAAGLSAMRGRWIGTEIKNYRSNRGMTFHNDVIDWLGGFPYEYATTGEIAEFSKKHSLAPVKIRDAAGPACWEMLLKKKA